MRYRDLIEARDPAMGDAYWVTPNGRVIAIDEEHPEWLRAYQSTVGLEDWQVNGDDANYYAIRKGWTRMVVYDNRTFIGAQDWPTAHRAFVAMVRGKYANVDPGAWALVDIYGDDPSRPVESASKDARAFFRQRLTEAVTRQGSTFQLWHGSRRWDGQPEIRAPRSGRYEAGPGIYFTTSYERAYHYAKGGGATMLAEIDRTLRLADDVIIPLAAAVEFVKTTPRMRHKKEIIADLQTNTARRNSTGVIASVLINLTVNYEAGSGDVGVALARFLRDQGVDASVEHKGGNEDWLVVIDPSVIRSMKRIAAKDVPLDQRHLPLIGLTETADQDIYYHGTNAQFDAFEPYNGTLGHGIYVTAYRHIAQNYADRHLRDKGGTAIVIPVTIAGPILWNGTPEHQTAVEQAAKVVRQADRRGQQVLFNDALREVVMAMGYVGVGASENIVVFEPRHLRRVMGEAIHYHGSSQPDPVFAPHHTGDNSHTFGPYKSTRYGIFFSDNPQYAALYGKVGDYQLNLHRTLDLENNNNAIWDFVQSFDPHDPEQRNTWIEAREIMFRDKHWQLFEDDVGERFVPFLQDRGYDSASFTEYTEDGGTEYQSRTTVVFDPAQVTRVGK